MARYTWKTRERDERRRAAAIEREQKAQLKQFTFVTAQRTVDTYEAELAQLTSSHEKCSSPVDWAWVGAWLPPVPPSEVHYSRHSAERARQLLEALGIPKKDLPGVDKAERADLQEFSRMQTEFRQASEDHPPITRLARGVLGKSHEAFLQVLTEHPPLQELIDGGVTLQYEVHSGELVECKLFTQGADALPGETKSITATGKLSIRPMPRSQVMTLYYSHICSSLLRVAREVLSVLPATAVLMTAFSKEGRSGNEPVLSAIVQRSGLSRINFASLNPTEALERFTCRVDFKASRRTGFEPIVPYQSQDVISPSTEMSLASLIKQSHALLDSLE